MLLKAHDEARRAPDPKAAVEMALIRLCYAADLPSPEDALKAIRDGAPVGGEPRGPGGGHSGGGGGSAMTSAARQLAPQAMAAPALPSPQSFDEVVALIDAKRDITLKLDVERFVRPISFRPGAITFEAAPGAPSNLAGRIVSRLKEWTGQPWLVATEGAGGGETAWEKEKREAAETRRQVEQDPFVRQVMEAFPGAEIVGLRQIPVPEAQPDEVVSNEDDDDD